jgi:type IV secretory pathway TraG/TraD family ATPase VirD4
MTTIAVLIVLAALYYAAKKTERGPSAPPPPQDPLDVPLLQWNDRDNFTGRELLRSASVIGASGSGKTSGVGKILMRALAARADVAVLIIASKPEDRATVEDIAAEAGRKLTVFGPNEPHRFNLIAGQCQAGADAREITDCILTTTEALTRNEGQSGESFWKFNETRMIHNAVEVIKQAFGTVDTWAIQRFINGAPTSRDQLESEEWRKGYFYTTSEKAHAKSKTLIESQDLELAEQYFLEEYPSMADKTRSSIIASVMGRLHAFNTGIVRELIGGATTVTPKVFDGGDWVFVDMPVSIHGPSGAVVAAAWKYATQRHILRRMATPETTITCVWIDEFQNHITGFDSDFLAECRSHKGCMVTFTAFSVRWEVLNRRARPRPCLPTTARRFS